MPRPTRWKGCVNGLKGRVRACFICPPIRLTSNPSKWPAPKLSSSCARLKRALWKHSMRRLLRPYTLFLRAMLKASSSMSDSVYDPYGNRYITHMDRPGLTRVFYLHPLSLHGPPSRGFSCEAWCHPCGVGGDSVCVPVQADSPPPDPPQIAPFAPLTLPPSYGPV